MNSASYQEEVDTRWGLTKFDPWDNRLSSANIWTIYKAMRDASPVIHSTAQGGFWCITRYDDVRTAVRDHNTFSSLNAFDIGNANKRPASSARRLIELDPPIHTRHRRVMQAPFLATKMGEFEVGIRASVNELLDKVGELGEFDIVEDLAEPIPQEALSRILGFDDQATKKNRELVLRYVSAGLDTRSERQADFAAFLLEKVREKMENPGDDYLSQMCTSTPDGEPFTEFELVGMVMGFALAGHHTSIYAIASLLRRLSVEKTKNIYLSDSSTATRIIEETLRCDPPIHLEGRTTTTPVTLGEVTIPEGESVALIYASANRDERQFENSETFNPHRNSLQHLAFGHGIHMCIGMHLARLEMKIILEEIMSRFPQYHLTGEPTETGMVFGQQMGWEKMPASIR